jgi:hypothetical protein|tara:strand:+ start:3331 stop:4251 length:921 start_codon:yes stop_codon:yes gene_type:complete
MKTLKFIYLLPLLLAVFTSCEKTEFEDLNRDTLEGVDWELYSGRVYVENLETGEDYYYDHFGPNKTTSNLDIYGGSLSSIDSLTINQSKWYFSNGSFILNGSKYYDYTSSGVGEKTQYNIVGVEPFSSARNIIVLDLEENYMTVLVYESYESYDGINYRYFSTLTFVRSGTSCGNCGIDVYNDYTYGGTLNSIYDSPSVSQSLNGTSWVITRYDEGMTPYYPNDTLEFISNVSYTINGGPWSNYTISNIAGTNMNSITLYECITLGGNYSGQVSQSFIEEGSINNVNFTGVFGTPNSVNVWFDRIN